MMRRNGRVVTVFLMAVVILACVPTLGPAAPVPTFDPNSINTFIVETANAALTQTALFTTPSSTPTATPTVTATPTETPTTIPTIVIVLFTPTVATPIPQVSGDEFDCAIISKSPTDGFGFSAGNEFTVTWQVLNTGSKEWDASSADIRYQSGTKMHLQSAYDLEQNVPPGQQYTVTVQMKAPTESGSYSTTWVIRTNAAEYCRMGVSIRV
jgi:hypothetical protein